MAQLNLYEEENLTQYQWFTPEWAAVELVERYFPCLTAADLVVEPSAGKGSFLKAIPDFVPAIGVELDAALVPVCRENSGREVIHGDFRTAELPSGITHVIGNPPFAVHIIESFLTRAARVLPSGGQVGFLLPAYSMQTHNNVYRWMSDFSIRCDLMPRNIFARSRLPLLFAVFTRDQRRDLVGMALYTEAVEFDRLHDRAKELLTNGRPRKNVWRALVEDVLTDLGGNATLDAIYQAIEPRRPTANSFWREKVRQQLQIFCQRTGPGEWSIATSN